jgi:hypothetical protein
MDELTEARRKAIAETIHPIGVEELKALGESLFPSTEHPWRTTFFNFINEHSGAAFHHGVTDDGVHVIYCQGVDNGMWFTAGGGVGPLQAKGLKILKEIVERKR